MILAESLAPRLLAKVTLCWLSSNVQTRCKNAYAVCLKPCNSCAQCHHSLFSIDTSFRKPARPPGANPLARKCFCCRLLLEHCVQLMLVVSQCPCTQGALCFSHCKVQVSWDCLASINSSHCSTWLACHPQTLHRCCCCNVSHTYQTLHRCCRFNVSAVHQHLTPNFKTLTLLTNRGPL